MDRRKMIRLLFLVAVLLVVICVLAMLFGGNEYREDHKVGLSNNDDNDDPRGETNVKIPSVSQLMYGIKYVGESSFDVDVMLENLYSNPRFEGYSVVDEYCMVYQITSDEELKNVKSFLGVVEELPKFDYDKESLIISIGRQLDKIKNNGSGITYNGKDVLEVSYMDEEYASGVVYIYKMNTSKFVSGVELEEYYWENMSQKSNMVLKNDSARQLYKAGTYYRLYKKESCYECELYANNGVTVCRRFISDEPVEVTEYKSSLIKLDFGDGNKYYNTERNVYSEEYAFNTEYLIYNYIRYMRVRNGEIQMIIRDAYDTYLYGKIVRLPFTNDTEDMDSLVKSVSVIDDTHISVEYYTGENRELVTATVEVYNLYR